MKRSFLEYAKIILTKVSFDKWLTLKEYTKLCKLLTPREKQKLDNWLVKNRKDRSQSPTSLIIKISK